jgi:CheY-like chemotaxis protein
LVEVASIKTAFRQIIGAQQDLLDALHFEEGSPRLRMKTVRAEDVIQRVVMANGAIAQGIELRGSRSTLTFVSDERLVERILNNLVINALGHSGGSKVLVGARRRADEILFEVRDNGRGIGTNLPNFAESKGKRISDQLGNVQLSRGGLGLFNVQVFTRMLGGVIGCNSFPGKGTAFCVRLPGPIASVSCGMSVRGGNLVTKARNKFVVVLDANRRDLRATESALQSIGVEVYADHDPLRWLNIVTGLKRMPDLILLGMDGSRGERLLELDVVRRKWLYENPKVVALTNSERSRELRSIGGVLLSLNKPLSNEALETLLDLVLSGRSLAAKPRPADAIRSQAL